MWHRNSRKTTHLVDKFGIMSNMESKTHPLFADDFGASVTNDSIYRAFILCQMGTDSNMARLKFFDPCGAATWYIADAELVYNDERDITDVRMFGLCDLGMGYPELGYVLLSELASVGGPLGLGIERDIYFTPTLLSELQ